jgi:DNA-directed RNA polymerase subunit beta'
MSEEIDETTGHTAQVIIEPKTTLREGVLRPKILIEDKDGKVLATYDMPVGAHLTVRDGEEVLAGDILAKIHKEISKTKDITGGLPRVSELFEARRPKEAAVVAEIDGVVDFAETAKGMRKIIIRGENNSIAEYSIPHGKHIIVHKGDTVVSGEPLVDGPVNPHDILRVKGEQEVQEYLVNEIQAVYRLQGVEINDKHIEIIIRQMLKKVRIEDPGETEFLEGEIVSRERFKEENNRVQQEGKRPAKGKPLLMGITKTALSTDSFVAAASFQETTRILGDAAVQGRMDEMQGLKENVIMGRLITAGTGRWRKKERREKKTLS